MKRLCNLAFFMAVLGGCSPEPYQHDRPLYAPDRSDIPNTEIHIDSSDEFSAAETSFKNRVAWPALFGPFRNGTVKGDVDPRWPAEGPPLVWEIKIGTGYGSPVTDAGRVVINHRIDDEEIVTCADAESGQILWEHRYPATAKCDFEYSNGPYSTPIIDASGNRVFNVGGSGQMVCLSLSDGGVRWSRNLHEDYGVLPDIFPVGASPLLDRESPIEGGQVLFNLGAWERTAGVIALRADTGETLWESTDQGASYGTPVVCTIADQRYAFVLAAEDLVCLDTDTGKVDWQFRFQRKGDLSRNATSPVVHGDKMIVLSGPGPGAKCVRILPDRTYQTLWQHRRIIDPQYNPLILSGDHLYSFTSGGQGGAELKCVDVETGEQSWTYHSVLKRGMGFATDRAIIILGENGHLAAIENNPERPGVISFTEGPLIKGPCYCTPAIFDNLLFLKNESHLAAFRLGP